MKKTVNNFKNMVISKYHEHNKPTLTLESIKSSEPIKRSDL